MNNPVATVSNMPITISIVIPVYRGEKSLPRLVEELVAFTQSARLTTGGLPYLVHEVVLVHDCGPDRSDLVIEDLAQKHAFIKPIWLTRNYGQHAATLAGMASSVGEWALTMDEDGQQNPMDLANMLDMAVAGHFQIVYANPINPPPHGQFRNACSRLAKRLALHVLSQKYQDGVFNSYRLVNGEISRIIGAYCGHGIYLDVALFWIANRIGYCPVTLRGEFRPSSYSFTMLAKHFWKMVITAGTRPLRLITFSGVLSILMALVFFGYALYEKWIIQIKIEGWTSLFIVIAFFSGLIMMSLGIVAEYLAMTMGIIMGKPLYVVSARPTRPPKP